jgi:hypothetical protein
MHHREQSARNDHGWPLSPIAILPGPRTVSKSDGKARCVRTAFVDGQIVRTCPRTEEAFDVPQRTHHHLTRRPLDFGIAAHPFSIDHRALAKFLLATPNRSESRRLAATPSLTRQHAKALMQSEPTQRSSLNSALLPVVQGTIDLPIEMALTELNGLQGRQAAFGTVEIQSADHEVDVGVRKQDASLEPLLRVFFREFEGGSHFELALISPRFIHYFLRSHHFWGFLFLSMSAFIQQAPLFGLVALCVSTTRGYLVFRQRRDACRDLQIEVSRVLQAHGMPDPHGDPMRRGAKMIGRAH